MLHVVLPGVPSIYCPLFFLSSSTSNPATNFKTCSCLFGRKGTLGSGSPLQLHWTLPAPLCYVPPHSAPILSSDTSPPSASPNLQWVSFGWLPPARLLHSQLCADAADSVCTCCEVSSAPRSWLLSVLGTGSPCQDTKQNKALCHLWLSFLSLLLSQKMSLVNSASFCKYT